MKRIHYFDLVVMCSIANKWNGQDGNELCTPRPEEINCEYCKRVYAMPEHVDPIEASAFQKRKVPFETVYVNLLLPEVEDENSFSGDDS